MRPLFAVLSLFLNQDWYSRWVFVGFPTKNLWKCSRYQKKKKKKTIMLLGNIHYWKKSVRKSFTVLESINFASHSSKITTSRNTNMRCIFISVPYRHNYSYTVAVSLLKPKIIVNSTVYFLGKAYPVYVELPFQWVYTRMLRVVWNIIKMYGIWINMKPSLWK